MLFSRIRGSTECSNARNWHLQTHTYLPTSVSRSLFRDPTSTFEWFSEVAIRRDPFSSKCHDVVLVPSTSFPGPSSDLSPSSTLPFPSTVFSSPGCASPKGHATDGCPPLFVSFGDPWCAPGSRSILRFRVQDAPPTLTGPTRVARLLSCRSEARRNGTCLVQARLLATVAMDTHPLSLPILPICLDRGAPVGNRDPLGIEPGTQPDTNGVGKGKGGRREDRGVQVPAGSIPREHISPIARTENDAAISTSGDTAGRGSCEVPP
eukprot:scaffold824_cov327-Pavlova_lutheri.AAC.19